MSQQTHNAFADAYQMSKISWSIDDNHFQKVLNSPKPPTKVTYKVKSREMTKDEWLEAKRQFKALNIKL